jgi:hypothetical protein
MPAVRRFPVACDLDRGRNLSPVTPGQVDGKRGRLVRAWARPAWQVGRALQREIYIPHAGACCQCQVVWMRPLGAWKTAEASHWLGVLFFAAWRWATLAARSWSLVLNFRSVPTSVWSLATRRACTRRVGAAEKRRRRWGAVGGAATATAHTDA